MARLYKTNKNRNGRLIVAVFAYKDYSLAQRLLSKGIETVTKRLRSIQDSDESPVINLMDEVDKCRQLFAGDGGEDDLLFIVVVHTFTFEVGAAAVQFVEDALADLLVFFGDDQYRLVGAEARDDLVHHHARHVNHQPRVKRDGPIFEGYQSEEDDSGIHKDEDSA